MKNVFLELEGNVDDLLMVNEQGTMKCTRLLDIATDSNNEDEEVMDVCITSTNDYGNLPKFDSLLGKRIKITIELVD